MNSLSGDVPYILKLVAIETFVCWEKAKIVSQVMVRWTILIKWDLAQLPKPLKVYYIYSVPAFAP